MKALPAVFFVKRSSLVIAALMFTAGLSQAQSSAPGAVQQPYYRQPGSAYVPPGTTARSPQPRQSAPAPAAQPGYQPGFGTPRSQAPAAYRPPGIKGTASKPKAGTGTASKSPPVSLEHKVARLEKNDAHQDRRLNHLERGTVSPTIEGSSASVADGAKFYTVRPGDTLWRIADKHSTSINSIKSVNRLSGETIAVGQTLKIPGQGSVPPTSAPASSGASHVVRPGDTFSQIAKANGVSQDALARANPSAYPDRLLIGERLVIPGKKGSSAPAYQASESSKSVASSSRSHVVKKGESLGAIAKMYGIPTASVASANKLKNANVIEPGQRLVIPGGGPAKSSAPVPSYFPPADSDTTPLPDTGLLASPAPAPAPMAAAPSPAPAYQPAPKPTPPVSSNRRGIVAYRLERGDDINTVSALFNTSPEKIRELNKLPADKKLKEGDEVVVPSLGAVSLN